MDEAAPLNESVHTLDYLGAVRRRWALVLLLAALVTAVALVTSLSSQKKYDATVELLLQDQPPANSLLDPGASAPSDDPQRDLTTNVQLIKIASTADTVRRQLGLTRSTNDLLDEISTQTDTDSNVVTLVARDPSPQLAAKIANAFAAAYVQFRLNSARRRYTEAADLARHQLEALGPNGADTAEGRDLQSRERELEIAAALQTGGAEVVRPATVPTSPSRPRPLLSGVLGLLIGLILGIVTALVLELVDRRLKDEQTVEEVFGLPIMAAIPRPPRRTGGARDHVDAEAYGLLAASLSLSVAHHEDTGKANGRRRTASRVLMVTSPSQADGKTSVTFGVAAACARIGLRVTVIEADLRRPAFSRFMDVGRSGGLAAVLDGSEELEDALIWVDIDAVHPYLEGRDEEGMIAALPAGELPVSPQRALSQRGMRDVIDRARATSDIVLIDTAPVGTVNDATTISGLVDEVVLVARLNQTTKDAARRAVRVLRNVGVNLVGVVVTDAATADRYGYYYQPVAAHPPEPSSPATPIER